MIKNTILVVLYVFLGCLKCASQESPSQIKFKIKKLKASENFNPENKEYIDLIIDLANMLRYSKTDTVKQLAVESLDLSTKIEYDKGKFESLLNFGYYELFTGKTDKATFYYQQSLDWALANNFKPIAINAYNGIGQAHFVRAEYSDAFLNFQKSLEIAEEIEDMKMIIRMNSNLGTLFSILEDYDEALNYYKSVQTKFNDSTDAISKIAVLVNLGYLYNKTKEPVKALNHLDESIELLQQIEAKKILAFAYLTKGDVYNQTGQYKKALALFEKAFHIYKMGNDKKNEADLYYNTGVAYSNLNNFSDAEEAYRKSLALYKSFNLKSGLAKSYKALYETSKIKGLTSDALLNLELAQKYSDSVGKEKQKRTISIINAKLAYKEKKAYLAAQIQMKLDEKKKQIIWVTIGLILSILLCLFIFRSTNIQKGLNKELALQTTMLSSKQKELHRINNNQDKLFSIVGHDLRAPILSLKQLLGTTLEKDAEIKRFYTYGPQLKDDVDHIHFTLDNLLNWGLAQMKANVNKPIRINVKEELMCITRFFTEALETKEIVLQLLVKDTLSIQVDVNHFNIIFRNLISNAIKFTKKNGAIVIDSYVENETAFITIRDTGVGMEKDVKTKIFSNKEHYTTLGTNSERGTGLGLILCQELIEKNKGHIKVQSELGSGSIFTVGFISLNQ